MLTCYWILLHWVGLSVTVSLFLRVHRGPQKTTVRITDNETTLWDGLGGGCMFWKTMMSQVLCVLLMPGHPCLSWLLIRLLLCGWTTCFVASFLSFLLKHQNTIRAPESTAPARQTSECKLRFSIRLGCRLKQVLHFNMQPLALFLSCLTWVLTRTDLNH